MNDEELAELAGGLRTAVNRLAHDLRRPGLQRGITPSRLSVLVILEKHGPLRAGDLAARMNISPASMSRLIEALLEGGWVAREADPADRRAMLVSLSDHGATALADLRRESTSGLADDLRALSAEQQRALATALPVLVELADRRTVSKA